MLSEWYEVVIAVLVVLAAAGLGIWVGWDLGGRTIGRGQWAKGYAEGVAAEEQRCRLRELEQRRIDPPGRADF